MKFCKSIFSFANLLRERVLEQRISAILADATPYRYYDTEELFCKLQAEYEHKKPKEYGYDSYSTWRRGFERAQKLLENPFVQSENLAVCEIAAGDGMAGYALANYGHRVTLTDMDDWRDKRAKPLNFVQSNIDNGLDLEDNLFDIVVSYNAFEHFLNPRRAFDEVVRICKPNGLIYLEFGPLYASPWGLHAYRSLYMPYPQFIFSPKFVQEKLSQIGISDLGKASSSLQPMNRWTVADFSRLWTSSLVEVLSRNFYRNKDFLEFVIRFPRAFSGRGLTFEDITVQGVFVSLKKCEIVL